MNQVKRRKKTRGRVRLKKYRVTILPTFGPVEVLAESEEEAEEWANHAWDSGWDGEFVAHVEEITPGRSDGASEET